MALESTTTAARLGGSNSKAIGTRGYLLAKLGRQAEAREVLAGMESIARERFLPPYGMALTLLGLGEHERALQHLEQGCELRDTTTHRRKVAHCSSHPSTTWQSSRSSASAAAAATPSTA